MAKPEEIEEEAVKRVCTLARHSNVPIIIDQPTSQSAIDVIRNQKEKGQVVVGQASVVAMAKNGSEYYNEVWSKAAAIVTSPPLRDDPNVQDLIGKFCYFYIILLPFRDLVLILFLQLILLSKTFSHLFVLTIKRSPTKRKKPWARMILPRSLTDTTVLKKG